jgi:MFS family permease
LLASDTFPTLSAAAGWFIDRIGSRRLPFLLCLVCLAGATALLAVGTNICLWIAGRLLQGVSAGMLWIVCLALLSDTVGQAGIGQAVGIIGIPMSLGPIVGPLLGGVIYAHGGYHSVFGLMFALLAIDAVLRLVMIEKKVAQKWIAAELVRSDTTDIRPEPDLPTSLSPCPESPNSSYTMKGNGNKTTIEARPSRKILHYKLPPILRLLLSFRMLVALTGGLLQSSLNVAFDSTLTLTVKALFGWQQTGQGLIFITILVPSLLQPIFGAMSDKYQQGRRVLAAGGCLLATPAYVLLRLVTQNTLGQKALLCVLLVIIGLAMAIAMPAIIAEVSATVTDAEKNGPQAMNGTVLATAWSLVNAAYAAGCMIGPLFSGFIRNAAGWQTTTWCLGLLSGITGVFLLLCLGGWIGKIRPKLFIARV